MYVGDEPQQLTYTVLDGDTIAGLVWASSNPDVAVVDKNGRVTAVAPGEATITVTNAVGAYGSCVVSVAMPNRDELLSMLEKAIQEAEALDLSQYKQDNDMEIFLKALETARIVLVDSKASEDQIRKALNDLKNAQKNLNLKPSNPGGSSDSWEENQPGYIGKPLPMAGSETGSSYPPMSSSFVSDTTTDFTITGGSYQFRITSKDGTVPVMTVTSSAFRVELVSQEGNDYFFRVTVVTPGQTADVLVNGGKVVSVTGGDAPGGVISDTTAPFQVSENGEYQFKLTANEKPEFVAGSPSFTVEFVKNEGKDWFFRIRATGKPGDACGFYINKSPKPVTVVTIA